MIDCACSGRKCSCKKYWHESNGIRAYIYFTEWELPSNHLISEIESAEMLIDPNVLRKLHGEYVFSIVESVNAEELGPECIGEWDDGKGNYNVRVYRIQSFS